MTYSLIGLGNMGSAILRGMRACGRFDGDVLCGYDRSAERLAQLQADCGLLPAASAEDAASRADVLLLAVKPQQMPEVLAAVKPALKPDATVISIAAGLTTASYEAALGSRAVVRAMPNLNAVERAAVTALCAGSFAAQRDLDRARAVFDSVGRTFILSEEQFHAFVAIGGSSPAFTYLYAGALAKAGVEAGLPEKLALEIACAAVEGSARMLAACGETPQEMARRVCSPGGTTIEGVNVLRERDFEAAVTAAAAAAADKDRRMGLAGK